MADLKILRGRRPQTGAHPSSMGARMDDLVRRQGWMEGVGNAVQGLVGGFPGCSERPAGC